MRAARAQIKTQRSGMQVHVLTACAQMRTVRSIGAGALPACLKGLPHEESAPAVRAAAAGAMTVRPASPAGLMRRDSSPGGLSNSEIARELFVSASTAKVHLVPVYSKHGENDRTAAARCGARALGHPPTF